MKTNMAQYMRNRRIERRNKLIELSGGSCEICGTTESLEFNHKDRFEKEFGLSGHALDKAWLKILAEWEKCELLCTEHHLERTQEQYKTGQIKSCNTMRHLPYVHGTMRMYQEKACRCDSCKRAKREYRTGSTVYSQIFV